MSEVPSIDLPRIAAELGFKPEQVANTVSLLDEGNTVPFITRYRKERTGNLDEEQIREIQKKVGTLRQLSERSQTVLRLIESQGKLTPALRQAIEQAETLKRLDDLYLPFRPKRTSRAAQARDRGLGPLANAIWNGDKRLSDLAMVAARFVKSETGLETTDAVLQGAADILSERIAEIADIRSRCRRIAQSTGRLTVSATKSGKAAEKEYRNYFEYSEAVKAIPPHRALAINRGEKEGVLRVKLEWDDARANSATAIYLRINDHPFVEFLTRCVADAIARLIAPSLEREIRREMTEEAETQAISVFARNLRNLLLQSPLHGARVFAIDPGFRTGCKTAVLDEYGNCLATDVIYVSGSKEKRAATLEKLYGLLNEHNCGLIALGNGTACRETEEMISELIADKMPDLRYLIVNEAGASVYSTSPVAREEFPDFDATVRGTISIGRRLLDPLSELVKIEPQHIGVGMYQHDVGSKRLKGSLDDVVESCVNYVGVDLNTASASLLRYVSGLNQLIARRVVEHRETNGRFTNRGQLRDVPGIGESTYTQAAGFLKIIGGDESLDNTWIHPESYEAARKLLLRMTVAPAQMLGNREAADDLRKRCSELQPQEVAEELSVGLPTFHDIVDGLTRPGRDPRSDQPGPQFRQGILKLDDLHKDMELTGTVLNVVDFGAFVDVGLKESGLVHISQLANRFIKSPHEIVSVGDAVRVWVIGVDNDRKRVSLTMISPNTQRKKRRKSATKKKKSAPVPQVAGASSETVKSAETAPEISTETAPVSTVETVVAETGENETTSAKAVDKNAVSMETAATRVEVSSDSDVEAIGNSTAGDPVQLAADKQSGLEDSPAERGKSAPAESTKSESVTDVEAVSPTPSSAEGVEPSKQESH